jgi:hypothetical protein
MKMGWITPKSCDSKVTVVAAQQRERQRSQRGARQTQYWTPAPDLVSC